MTEININKLIILNITSNVGTHFALPCAVCKTRALVHGCVCTKITHLSETGFLVPKPYVQAKFPRVLIKTMITEFRSRCFD